MFTQLTRVEKKILLCMAVFLGMAALLPPISGHQHYHLFADQRSWLGIPHFADVASNLMFSICGLLGLLRLRAAAPQWLRDPMLMKLFFFGLLLTGPGSAYYHWAPDEQTIVWDRAAMVVAFAGVVGTFVAQRVTQRIGRLAAVMAVAMGAAGLGQGLVAGDLSIYIALQFGGMVGLVAGMAMLRTPDPLPWGAVIGWYLVAKVLEAADRMVWVLTAQMLSGHTLKHVAAGMAGVMLLQALKQKDRAAPAGSDAAAPLATGPRHHADTFPF
ncbi:MAG TPA: hypothetical protein VIM12_16075 [Noviherbaspirillum sp.]|uniref:hypothetical protein n=1 Tax=Noviherbaspirillum sp. TaxID=1926288 RepID=UPI002F952892